MKEYIAQRARALAATLNASILNVMPMTVDQLVEESLRLPQTSRAELVERILLGAHGGVAPEVEAAWKAESRRRIADIQAGTAKGRLLDDALAEARKIVGL